MMQAPALSLWNVAFRSILGCSVDAECGNAEANDRARRCVGFV